MELANQTETDTTDTSTDTTEEEVVEEHPETVEGNSVSQASELADKAKEIEIRKLTLPTQGAVAELQEQYNPPTAYEPEDKTASSFKTADDAQMAYLREEIDEDVFSQVVSRLGKPSNKSEDDPNRMDLGFSRQLPKWAFPVPTNVSPSVEEMLEVMAIEQEERDNATQLEAVQDPPYKDQQTLPNPM